MKHLGQIGFFYFIDYSRVLMCNYNSLKIKSQRCDDTKVLIFIIFNFIKNIMISFLLFGKFSIGEP